MKRLIAYLKPYTPLIAASLICAAISVAATLVLPILVGKAVDCMIEKDGYDRLIKILTLMLLFVAVAFISQYIMGRINIRIQASVVRGMRNEAFDSLVQLPIADVDKNSFGDLESRIVADADAVGDGLLMGFSQFFSGVLTIIGTIALLFSISITIAPVVVLLTPLSLYVARFISGGTKKYFNEQAELRGEITEYADERIHAQKLICSFGAGQRTKESFAPLNDKLNEASLKATFYSSLPNPSSRFINNLIYMAVGVLGALSCISGGISVGALTSFLSYASGYAKPFNEITGVITELQNAIVCAKRLFSLIDMEGEDITGDELIRVGGSVRFDDVSFSYDKKNKLIEDLNISVNRGDHVAIVGPTGAGKTTLVNLLMRFYDTDSGKICVDGNDISGINRNSLRRNYGMVLQETWLREGTIFENITLGKKDATMDEVIEAAKRTRAHDFIRKLPRNYYTTVGRGAGILSQGQKQLICITRIMLSLPPMLILDEATSSIDTRTEMKIQDAFKRMMQNRTTFIVAHRLSTIRHSDLILYMEGGKVLESGTHEELLTTNGRYARLYKIK